MSGIKNLKNPEKSAEEELDASTWSEDGPLGTLTRQDIALAIFDRCEGLSRREAKRLVDSVIEEMIGTLT